MQFQDVKPTAFSDPSSHWRNETNAYDGNLATFADNQPKPKIPNYVQFSGQTINLGANEAIFCIRLTLKLGTTGFVNDTWEVTWLFVGTMQDLTKVIFSIIFCKTCLRMFKLFL